MFSMRKFFALVFMVLMWVSSAWAADYYVVPSSNGEKIKYVKVNTSGNGTLDTSQWTNATTETTLRALLTN